VVLRDQNIAQNRNSFINHDNSCIESTAERKLKSFDTLDLQILFQEILDKNVDSALIETAKIVNLGRKHASQSQTLLPELTVKQAQSLTLGLFNNIKNSRERNIQRGYGCGSVLGAL
jgi:hypothetical protein